MSLLFIEFSNIKKHDRIFLKTFLLSSIIFSLLFCYKKNYFYVRQKAEVNMDGQFLVRQIYDDEITYGLIGAAVEVLSESFTHFHYLLSPTFN
jgi:hypothetical protein